MAEKKFGLGTALLIGAAAAAVAGGVVFYIKRAEIKRLADEIMTRVKPADDADGEIGDWDIRADTAETDAQELNIVDSGISLESVESPAEDTVEDTAEEPAGEAENAPADGAQPESGTQDADTQPECEADTGSEEPEAAQEPEQTKKKTWFWSK